ncbi:MAG TPA: hypothetical protein VHX49_17035 [Candidatus Acidoferrales bacterium]|jgi:hypothetical protein|nr:hypothetical protein [Candidatus Acidoferrales bacterium]
MKSALITGVVLAFLLFGSPALTPANLRAAGARPRAAAGSGCDRACLDGLVDQYLKALVAHDPSRLPLAKDVKFTEDGVELKPGDGLWATATGLGNYRLDFAEPEAGGVGCYAVIQENGTPVFLWLRLKVVKHRITEIETLVARKQTTSLLNTNNLTTPPAIFLETAAEADRPSREEMVAIVSKYFDGIEQGNGDIVPFDKDAMRIENGVQTCPSLASSRLGALSCGEQLGTKIFTYIQSVSPRRFPLVDRERGLVLARVRFNHPGSQQTVEVPGHGMMSMGAFSRWPNSTQIAELFKIENRKIRDVTAVIVTGTYKAPTGWE